MWIGLIVVVIVIVILLAAVFGGLLGPPEERVLKIGTVLSITGGLQAFGGKNQQGADLAIEEINAAGGVLGRPVQVFHQNDNSDPDTARAAAATLISQNRVDAIIGATGSGQCETVVAVARANGVFEISGSCTSPKFSNTTLTGGWWARTAPSDALQGVVAAVYAHDNRTWNRAAVIGINNAYGSGLAQVFFDKFRNLGGTMSTTTPRIVPTVQQGALDYTADLQAVLNVPGPGPQVLYVVAYPPDGVLLMQNFQAALGANPGWGNIQLLFSEGLFDQGKFLDILEGQGISTTAFLGTAPSAYGGLTGLNYSAWAATYRTRWGVAPGLFDDGNYDAAYLIALAAQKAGSASGQAIKDNIVSVANPPGTVIYPGQWAKAVAELAAGRDVDYEGASGSVNIDSRGDPFSGYIVWGVNSGTKQWEIREIFPESLVDQLVPAPPMPGTRGADIWAPLAAARWD